MPTIATYRILRESEEATLYLYGTPAACAPILAALGPEEVHDLGAAASEDEARAVLSRLAAQDEPGQDASACVLSAAAWVAWEGAEVVAGVH